MDDNRKTPLGIIVLVVVLLVSMILIDSGIIAGPGTSSDSGGSWPSRLGCQTCGREKKINCYSCGGSKSAMCMKCLGVTFKICQICAGSGKKKCTECLGLGYWITHIPEIMRVPCETCGESGYVACPTTIPCTCGNGKQICTSCDENGKIDCPSCD